MISWIKKYFLKKYLAENKPNRSVQIMPLHKAKTIGLLCEITDEDSYKDIFYIFTKLQERGHQVRLVGYINDKEVPFYCLPQLTADYFCQKHLNWYGIPNMEQIQDFLKEDYDMIIDFNYRLHPAVQSILALSHAKFIVGRLGECQNAYDLFLNDTTSSNLKYLEAVNKYTQKLTGDER